MKKESIWKEAILPLGPITPLKENLETDVLIIGGGMAGMTTAFYLKDSGQKIVIIDKGHVGMGVTSCTTGKLTFLQGTIYHTLAETYDKATAMKYLSSQKRAIALVSSNVSQYGIDCSYEEVDSYVFTNDEKEKIVLEKQEELFTECGIPYQSVENLPIDYPVLKATRIHKSAVFHPLKYLYGLKQEFLKSGGQIYEEVEATKLKREKGQYLIETSKGIITAKTVVFACHYPFFFAPLWIPFQTHLEKSYLLASKVEETKLFSAIEEKAGATMRYLKEPSYFIYGGYSHNVGSNLNQKDVFRQMEQDYQHHFSTQVDYEWSTHDVITEDHLPIIGRMKKEEALYIATGFNKWGMTNGTIAGKLLSDLILGITNEYEGLFDPHRPRNMEKWKNFFRDGSINIGHFLKTKLKRNYPFYQGNAKAVLENGTWYGIYQDEKGVLHKVYLTCPHMKCSLVFNNQAKTWDCPCHGSRFTIDGDIFEGPSTYSIKVPKEKD